MRYTAPFRAIRNQRMSRHPALQSLVFLRRTYVARDDVGQCHIIATVGEALRFLARLPVELDGIHWVLASNGLCWAHRQRELGTEFATVAFENALATDGLLIDALSPAKSIAEERTDRAERGFCRQGGQLSTSPAAPVGPVPAQRSRHCASASLPKPRMQNA